MNKGSFLVIVILASLALGAGSAYWYYLQPREYAVKAPSVEYAQGPFQDMSSGGHKPGAANPGSGDVTPPTEPGEGSSGELTPLSEFAMPFTDDSQICEQQVLYDARGNPYYNAFASAIPDNVPTVANYNGPSPLYEVQPYSSTACDPQGNLRLQKITPAQAHGGKPFYAILTTVKIKKDSMHAGESNILSADIEMPERFNPAIPATGKTPNGDASIVQSAYYVESLDPSEVMKVNFGIESTAFELKPAEAGARVLGVGRPASFRWIISPKGDAAGEQFLVLAIDSGRFKISQDVQLVIEEVGRLEPIYVGMTVSIGSFFITTYMPKAFPLVLKKMRAGTKKKEDQE